MTLHVIVDFRDYERRELLEILSARGVAPGLRQPDIERWLKNLRVVGVPLIVAYRRARAMANHTKPTNQQINQAAAEELR